MHFVTLPDTCSDTAPAFSDPASLHRWLKALPQTQPLLLLNSLREQVHAVDASLAPPGEVIALLDGLRQGVERAQAALHQLAREQGEAQAAEAAAGAQLAALDLELAAQQAAAARLEADWQAHPLHAELQAQAPAALPALHRETTAELDALLHTEARWRDSLRRRDAAQQALDAAGQQLAETRAQLGRLELEHHGARQSLQDCATRLTELEQHLDEQLAPLDEAISAPGWRSAWRADPAAFCARCAARAEAWLAHRQRVTDGEARAASLAVALAAAEDAAARVRQHSATALDAAGQLAARLDADRQARAGLFDGAPTAATEAAFDQAIADSRSQLDAACHACQQVEADAARLAEIPAMIG